jgi:hypothetical protein
MQQPADNRLLAAAHKLLVVDIGVMVALAVEAVARKQPAVGAEECLQPQGARLLQHQLLQPVPHCH